jgi:hypothetical protein
MIVIVWPPSAFFEIKGKKIEVHFSQETADLARQLALKPELVDRLDVGSMTLKEERHEDAR